MNKPVRILFVAFCLALLSGCPYESSFPLAAGPNARIDPSLIGEWDSATGKDGEKGTLSIYPKDDREYVVVLREVKNGKDDLTIMQATAETIGSLKFLSIRELGFSEHKSWMFLSYTVSGNTLTATTVEDALLKGKAITSQAELRSIIEANLNNPALLASDKMVFTKIGGK